MKNKTLIENKTEKDDIILQKMKKKIKKIMNITTKRQYKKIKKN